MKKIGFMLLPIVTIVLEILPSGAVLIFAPSPTEAVRKTYSYFSLVPLGYANFAPFVTALLTCFILLLAFISIKRSSFIKAVFIISLIAAIISLLPLVYGIRYNSVIGSAITVTLAVESVLAKLAIK